MFLEHGAAGAAVAVGLLLAISMAAVFSGSRWKHRMYAGGILMAVSQLFWFPNLQGMLVTIAMETVVHLGIGRFDSQNVYGHATSETGGFILVIFFGGTLLSLIAALGWIGVFFSGSLATRCRWFQNRD